MSPVNAAKLYRPRLASWLLPLLVMLPLLWALLPGGLPDTADSTVHFVRATEMIHAWQAGILLPRWAANLAFGYGIPLFVYAPPLPYILVAALYLMGLPAEMAYKGMLVVGILVGGTGAFHLARRLLGDWAGVVAAAAFLYAPIGLRELFIQGNAAQYLAWAFPPWTAWAIVALYAPRVSHQRSSVMPLPAAVLALALAGTLLCHNAVALILMGMISLQGIILWAFTRRPQGLIWTVSSSLLGLALSAWFWVPALLEGKYIALDRIVGSDYRQRFIALGELLAWSPRLDRAAINPYFPLTLGGAQLVGAALGVLGLGLLLAVTVFGRRGAVQRTQGQGTQGETTLFWGTGTFMLLFALFCGFMATEWSAPMWEVLPFVEFFEWPFRWHGFTALGLSWLCAAVVALPRYWGGSWQRGEAWIASPLLALLIGSALVNLYPLKLAPGTRIISPYEVARYEARSKAVGTTSLGEFNPIWVEGVLDSSPLVEDYLARQPINRLKGALPPGGEGVVLAQTPHHQRYQVTLPAPATITLNLLYFPGWRATLDGEDVPVHPAPGSGLLTLDLPAGRSVLDLHFGATPLRFAMQWLSTVAWIGLIGAGVWQGWRQRKQAGSTRPLPDPSQRHQWRRVAGVAGVIAAIWLLQVTQPHAFQMTSPPGVALPAAIQVQADFEDKLQLIGLDPLPTVAAPGDRVTVVAYWRVLQDLDEDYSVFLHLDDPLDGTTLVTVDQRHPDDTPTSDWATGQYVRNVLKLDVPPTLFPIRYPLRAGFYDPDTGQQLDVAGTGSLVLGYLWIEAKPTPQPPRQGPQVAFDGGIELLGVTHTAETVTFYWRSDGSLAQLPGDYTIFVHLLGSQGDLIGQLDGAPYANRYALRDWQPQTVVADTRLLADAGVSAQDVASIRVGIYERSTYARLPARTSDGALLDDAAVAIAWEGS